MENPIKLMIQGYPHLWKHIYTYIHTCVCIYICIYIYVQTIFNIDLPTSSSIQDTFLMHPVHDDIAYQSAIVRLAALEPHWQTLLQTNTSPGKLGEKLAQLGWKQMVTSSTSRAMGPLQPWLYHIRYHLNSSSIDFEVGTPKSDSTKTKFQATSSPLRGCMLGEPPTCSYHGDFLLLSMPVFKGHQALTPACA